MHTHASIHKSTHIHTYMVDQLREMKLKVTLDSQGCSSSRCEHRDLNRNPRNNKGMRNQDEPITSSSSSNSFMFNRSKKTKTKNREKNRITNIDTNQSRLAAAIQEAQKSESMRWVGIVNLMEEKFEGKKGHRFKRDPIVHVMCCCS